MKPNQAKEAYRNFVTNNIERMNQCQMGLVLLYVTRKANELYAISRVAGCVDPKRSKASLFKVAKQFGYPYASTKFNEDIEGYQNFEAEYPGCIELSAADYAEDVSNLLTQIAVRRINNEF